MYYTTCAHCMHTVCTTRAVYYTHCTQTRTVLHILHYTHRTTHCALYTLYYSLCTTHSALPVPSLVCRVCVAADNAAAAASNVLGGVWGGIPDIYANNNTWRKYVLSLIYIYIYIVL